MKQLSARQVYERSITEEDVFGACRQLLELKGAVVHRVVERIPWGPKGRTSDPGIPDLFGWFPSSRQWPGFPATGGRPLHFFIEIKKPGGRQRIAQINWIEDARRQGVVAFFADSVDAMIRGFQWFGIDLA